MASILQRIGAATSLSSSNSFDTKKFNLSSRRSLIVRKMNNVVVRSDGSNKMNCGLNSKIGGRADHLVTNAVVTKPDVAAASTASKPGKYSGIVLQQRC